MNGEYKLSFVSVLWAVLWKKLKTQNNKVK